MKIIRGIKIGGLQQKILNPMLIFIIALIGAYAAVLYYLEGFGSPWVGMLIGGLISVVCALIGILLSLVFSTPVGPTIVAADLTVFLVFLAVGRLCKR